jgi:hypothetical protein
MGVGLVGVLAGCATAPPDATGTHPSPVAPSAVTQAQYDAAFFDFAECLENEGHAVIYTRGEYLMDMSIPNDAVADGSFADCYTRHFMAMDSAWQLANEHRSPTQQRLRDCLRELGVDPEESVEGVQRQLEEHRVDVQACLG